MRRENQLFLEAVKLHRAGFNLLPIAIDGTKRPLIKWKCWKDDLQPYSLVCQWFNAGSRGLAVIGGSVSGNFCCLDFDNHKEKLIDFEEWKKLIPAELFSKLVIYTTPSLQGCRVCYRLTTPPTEWTTKRVLARTATKEVMIEELFNQEVIVPGGDLRVHKSCLPYLYVQNHLVDTQIISDDEHLLLVNASQSFNQFVVEEVVKTKPIVVPSTPQTTTVKDRPGDDYNARASWEEVLTLLGWTFVSREGEVKYWRRPDKDSGVSATTNYGDTDLLYVFSSSVAGLESEQSYTKFAVLTHCKFNGDFNKSARWLRRKGYGGGKLPSRREREAEKLLAKLIERENQILLIKGENKK